MIFILGRYIFLLKRYLLSCIVLGKNRSHFYMYLLLLVTKLISTRPIAYLKLRVLILRQQRYFKNSVNAVSGVYGCTFKLKVIHSYLVRHVSLVDIYSLSFINFQRKGLTQQLFFVYFSVKMYSEVTVNI